ncbi:MAG: hypothetical protein ILP01_02690 [Clostridia bacterium]|nr:hypothetical protein [Clostridia bacterium]
MISVGKQKHAAENKNAAEGSNPLGPGFGSEEPESGKPLRRVAVWGPPGSGKTTLAVRLAAEISSRPGIQVILLLADRSVPVLPVLFPGYRDSELPSLGSALSSVEMTAREVLSAATVCSERANLLFLGYSVGENMLSYPETGENRALSFLELLDSLCDCLIVDCPPALRGDTLSSAAMKSASAVLRLYTPEMRSFSFFDSQLPLMSGDEWRADRHLKILNNTGRDIFFPVDETRRNMLRCDAELPYSLRMKQAMSDGRLLSAAPEKRYARSVRSIASMLTAGR